MLVPKSIFEIVRCASTDPTRQQLAAVHFRRQYTQPVAEVTNGKVIVLATWPEDDQDGYPDIGVEAVRVEADYDAAIPVKACKDIAKAIPKRHPKPILENAVLAEPHLNGKLRLGATDLDNKAVIETQLIDYPAIIKPVVEKLEGLPVDKKVKVNPTQLAEVLTTMVRMTNTDRSEMPTCELEFPEDGEKAFRIRLSTSNGIKVTSYVMPVIDSM